MFIVNLATPARLEWVSASPRDGGDGAANFVGIPGIDAVEEPLRRPVLAVFVALVLARF